MVFFFQYTNFLEINDFWKVESMRGTYITSMMNSGECVLKILSNSLYTLQADDDGDGESAADEHCS